MPWSFSVSRTDNIRDSAKELLLASITFSWPCLDKPCGPVLKTVCKQAAAEQRFKGAAVVAGDSGASDGMKEALFYKKVSSVL